MESEAGARAIVALGCRVMLDPRGRLAGALARRVRAAAEEYVRRCDAGSETVLVVTGGRRWPSAIEADAMADELAHLGVPRHAVVRERCSLSTADNARFTAAVLTRRGIARATVVTCAWHLPRAMVLFRAMGLEVEGVPVETPGDVPAFDRVWQWSRERVLTWASRSR